jgi:large subunit ribosomal protein L14
MIQKGTILNVIDNSGAKSVRCIQVLDGFRRRYAFVGDTIVVSVKTLRSKRKAKLKVNKGDVLKALIVRAKSILHGKNFAFFENSVLLLNRQHKLLGTRIFGAMPSSFRFSRFLRIVSLAVGLVK